MVARSHAGPLTATISERIEATPEISVIRRRPAPPPTQLALVGTSTESATVPKKKRARKAFTEAYKAKVIAQVVKARKDGSGNAISVAKSEGISVGNIQNWMRLAGKTTLRANKANGKPGRRRVAPGDLSSVTNELKAALVHVDQLKKQLRALLDD